jgi:hypothetical protein
MREVYRVSHHSQRPVTWFQKPIVCQQCGSRGGGLSRDRGDQAAFANCGHGEEIGLNTRPSPAPNMPL